MIESLMVSEGDWQPVAKKRLKKGMKKLFSGKKNIAKHGKPFTIDPDIGSSNAFLAKESECADEDGEELEEISAMGGVGGGAVQGYSAPIGKKEDEEDLDENQKEETN